MHILQALAQALRKARYVKDFESATKKPLPYQENLLLEIVRKNRDTEYGIRHRFGEISSIKDFQRNVPISSYDDLLLYIQKIKQGKPNVLTREPCILLGLTSGTTGKPKYCPVTESFAEDYKKNWEIWLYYASNEHPSMFDGKILSIVSPEKEGCVEGGIPYGSISGLMAEKQSRIIKSFYAVPHVVYSIKDYDSRYYAILRLALEQDVSFLITPNPSTILLLIRKAVQFRQDIIDDIRQGTLKEGLNIPENIRKEILRRTRPNRARAGFLAGLPADEFYPKRYWRKLALIACWKEGALPMYLRQFAKYFGSVPVRDIGLMSTEGRASIPTSDEGGEGVLAVTTHFYEFISTNKRHTKAARVLRCDELEAGKDYFIIFTTSAGLYRYNTNDIIKVVGFCNKAPVIEFLHKAEHVTDLAGEKLTEWQVVTAIREASRELKIPVDSFTAVAKLGKVPHYDLLMEFHSAFPKQTRRAFLARIDECLKELNVEYRRKRESERLGRPLLKIVAPGGWHELHKKRSIEGAHDSQVKIASLTDNQEFESHFRILETVT
jgi:hypothetical protein